MNFRSGGGGAPCCPHDRKKEKRPGPGLREVCWLVIQCCFPVWQDSLDVMFGAPGPGRFAFARFRPSLLWSCLSGLSCTSAPARRPLHSGAPLAAARGGGGSKKMKSWSPVPFQAKVPLLRFPIAMVWLTSCKATRAWHWCELTTEGPCKLLNYGYLRKINARSRTTRYDFEAIYPQI